jgi:uncharacterized phage protein gp47/JayE
MSTTTPTVSPSTVTQTDPTVDFLPLFPDQTEDTILTRMEGWANEGLDPVGDAEQWVDTREGGHWRTCCTPGVREFARLYDLAGTEVPMSAFILWAWGQYLDDLAAVYDIERKVATASTGTVTFTGPAGSIITQGTNVATVPTSANSIVPTFAVDSDVTIPGSIGTNGEIDASVTATEAGSIGDVASGAIIAQSTPLPPGVTFTNALPTLGGTDPEPDDSLRQRALNAAESGHGPGNVADYITWAGGWPGVGRVKVVPVWEGPGTVLVDVEDPSGQPVSTSIVNALQAYLDPVAGQGAGIAPVGAAVTVATSTLVGFTYAATVTYKDGYTADGAGNTVALQTPIAAAMEAYLTTIQPGDKVVISHLNGILATWEGVEDITAATLNGATANITLSLSPPQAAYLETLTI